MNFYASYFLYRTTLELIAGVLLVQLGAFIVYRRVQSPSARSRSLYPILSGSIFLWAFVGASLILCTVFLAEYEVNPRVGRFVLGASILSSLVFSSVMTVVSRKVGAPRILKTMAGGSYPSLGISDKFRSLARRVGFANAELREAQVGNAFSLEVRGRKVVAVSTSLVESLTPDEVEAVLAHELSHLKNRDSIGKGLARLAHVAFPFDPIVRLVEAALHRERELLADRSSVSYTGKPLSLASALVKVHAIPTSIVSKLGGGLFIGGSGRGLFSLYPNLQKRVELLLELADRMKIAQRVEIPA